MQTKRFLVIFALLFPVFAISPASALEKYSENHELALQHFKTKEKIVKDAVWTAKDVFKVGVLDNKSPRDGYALYVCEVLADYGFKGKNIWVQVIDIAKLMRTDKWVKLGEAHCQ